MKKTWHPNFVKYMDFIVNHPNYSGLPINKKPDGSLSWIAPKQSLIGQDRIKWAKIKAKELGINPDEAGYYAKVMFEIHPTKEKVCQICGKKMSLYYLYPNKHLIDAIDNKYKYHPDKYQKINDICDALIKIGESEKDIKTFLISHFKLGVLSNSENINEIIRLGELNCRKGFCKALGPGAMSNFPDRYDGFHTYNRCCRSSEDKGRHSDNMKTYTKDRRAYEYWSDGNIQAANKFMGSQFFKNISADHVGPISLGFVHDPRYLRPLPSGENSSKRDRLSFEDINMIVDIEQKTKISPISWFSQLIWVHIKYNYKSHPDKIENYRQALKQNMHDFMSILYEIVERTDSNGKLFLKNSFIDSKLKYFNYDYKFDELGNIICTSERNITDATRKEESRYLRIAFESIIDYHEKENRNLKSSLDSYQYEINMICEEINNDPLTDNGKLLLKQLINKLQHNAINRLK